MRTTADHPAQTLNPEERGLVSVKPGKQIQAWKTTGIHATWDKHKLKKFMTTKQKILDEILIWKNPNTKKGRKNSLNHDIPGRNNFQARKTRT